MPELPEVETVRLGLQRLLPGRQIVSVTHDWAKSFPNAQTDIDAFLIGARVLQVKRRAKVLLIELDSNYSLVIHLKMTGQLVFIQYQDDESQAQLSDEMQGGGEGRKEAYAKVRRLSTGAADAEIKQSRSSALSMIDRSSRSAELGRFGAGHPNGSLIGALPDKSTRVIFELSEDAKLFFNDQRKFGWVKLIPTVEVPEIDFFKKVGPEPLGADFSAQAFIDRLQRRKKSSIKAVLLDQTVIAGVGNIYADESLFAATIHPASIVANIPKKKLIKLFHELQAVLRLSIEKGGSSDRNYVNAEGKKGSYISFAKVFRREKQACLVCETTIIKIRVAGRGTHICPNCQPLVS